MAAIKRYPATGSRGGATVTIATGPVIIENGKVLLDKHGDDTFWKFPGGTLESGLSWEDNARREVKEELGIDVELLSSTPEMFAFTREVRGTIEYVILVHYPARRLTKTIKTGRDVREYCWADIDNLPKDCAPNIKPIIERLRATFK